MNITIKSKRYEVTNEKEVFVRNKLKSIERLLGQKSDNALAEVELETVEEGENEKNDRNIHRVEINVSVEGSLYRGESTKHSMREAFDLAKNELREEIRRAMGKKESLARKGGRAFKKLLRFGK